MTQLITYGRIADGREFIRRWVKERQPNYSVIDIGGQVNGWTSDLNVTVADINAKKLTDFKMNVSKESDWQPLLNFVIKHGLFDLAICTHTIEDISNPQLLLDMLPKVAKEGFITAPSVLTEQARIEGSWTGYIHHRHLVGKNDKNEIVLAPKLGFLEYETSHGLIEFNPAKEEIFINWVGDIKYRMIMDDYLGPDVDSVLQAYRHFIAENI